LFFLISGQSKNLRSSSVTGRQHTTLCQSYCL